MTDRRLGQPRAPVEPRTGRGTFTGTFLGCPVDGRVNPATGFDGATISFTLSSVQYHGRIPETLWGLYELLATAAAESDAFLATAPQLDDPGESTNGPGQTLNDASRVLDELGISMGDDDCRRFVEQLTIERGGR